MTKIRRDGCGRRISNLVQCQACGWSVEHASNDTPPDGWNELDRQWFCDQCTEEERPLLGAEYDEEFDQTNYGPNDIGRRAPCDGYFVA